MTQPAISQALGRLRSALRDDLFVRTPEGMEPTPYAEQLAGPVRAALKGFRSHSTAPPSSTRDCRARLHHRGGQPRRPGPGRAARDRDRAEAGSGCLVDMRPSGTLDVAEFLDRGELDLAFGGLAAPGERFSDLGCSMMASPPWSGAGHPAAEIGARSRFGRSGAPASDLSSTGEETAFVDAELASYGLARRVALRAPLLAAAPRPWQHRI